MAARISSARSAPQLPVMTVSAPDALILAMYGEKSLTCAIGCRSSPAILMSGPLALQVFLGGAAHRLAERVVLADDVDALDVLVRRHVAGQRFHLHVRIGVEAEVPEAALAVGHVRIDGGVVQEHHFLARIALVVLVDRVQQRQADARAVALRDVAVALVDHRLQLGQRLLRAALVVEADHFNLVLARPLLLRRQLGDGLETVQLVLPDRRKRPRQRVDESDFYRVGLGRKRRGEQGERYCCGQWANLHLHLSPSFIVVLVGTAGCGGNAYAVGNL